MLRYFYLLCLLVCLDLSFCYEFTKQNGINRKVIRKGKAKREQMKMQHQEYLNEPIANIDVASFIRQPDPEYDSLDDNSLFQNNNRDYGEYESLSDSQDQVQHESAPQHADNTFALYSGKMGAVDNLLQNPFHNTLEHNSPLKTEKKLSKKIMRFPFFSRKKTVTPKTKKNRKRRLLGFHSAKTSKLTTNLPKMNDPNPILKGSHINLKINKRATADRFCPLCKRKIGFKKKKKVGSGNKAANHKIIHNSRQYFQEATERTKNEQRKETARFDENKDNVDDSSYYTETNRKKRRHNRDERRKREDVEKDRQLKELEEVQRRVDSVEIATSNNERTRIGNKFSER